MEIMMGKTVAEKILAAHLVEGELRLSAGPRLSGVGEFDVRWWGLEPPKLFMMRVDPIVTVEIDLPLI